MRKSAIPVAVIATFTLLAACSGGDSSAETTPKPSSSSAAADNGALVVWTDENRQPAVEAAAVAFTSETGVKVETVVKNFDDIRADFLAQVPTGEGPDITVGAHDWLGSLIEGGVIDSIDLADKADEFEGVTTEAFTSGGQLYGLPYAFEAIAVVRNTDLVDSTPATFDEMIEKGRAAGTKMPLVVNANGTTGDGYTFYGFQNSFGAPVFEQTEDGSFTTEVGMSGENGQAFATWLGANGMTGTGVFSTDYTDDIAIEEFSAGNAPYTITGPWNITKFQDAGINVAVDPIPSAGGQPGSPFVGVQGFYLSAQSKNALVANDFLVNYIATPEAMMALYEADPRIPAMSSVAQEVASDPILAGFLASAQQGTPMPSIPEMGSVWDFWNAAQASIITGTADPVGVWDKMISDLTAAIS